MFYTYKPSMPSTANVDANANTSTKKDYTPRYDENTWLKIIRNAVNECVADNVPVTTLNVEERLKDLFGCKIGNIYKYEKTTPDGNVRYIYEARHKEIIRKMMKRLITLTVANAI